MTSCCINYTHLLSDMRPTTVYVKFSWVPSNPPSTRYPYRTHTHLKIKHVIFPQRIIRATKKCHSSTCKLKTMALLRCMRPIDGLPDPTGPPSCKLPSATIVEGNRLVHKVMRREKRKRGPNKTHWQCDGNCVSFLSAPWPQQTSVS